MASDHDVALALERQKKTILRLEQQLRDARSEAGDLRTQVKALQGVADELDDVKGAWPLRSRSATRLSRRWARLRPT